MSDTEQVGMTCRMISELDSAASLTSRFKPRNDKVKGVIEPVEMTPFTTRWFRQAQPP
ncbi:MAG: hypothetical protein SFU91_03660 [Chloroherpetonaceae bacterium]|nr:hypothetical protein [Chloroherpetonaceae bacterium]